MGVKTWQISGCDFALACQHEGISILLSCKQQAMHLKKIWLKDLSGINLILPPTSTLTSDKIVLSTHWACWEQLHPSKLIWQWKIPVLNRQHYIIFKWWIFCHVIFRGCTFLLGCDGNWLGKLWSGHCFHLFTNPRPPSFHWICPRFHPLFAQFAWHKVRPSFLGRRKKTGRRWRRKKPGKPIIARGNRAIYACSTWKGSIPFLGEK